MSEAYLKEQLLTLLNRFVEECKQPEANPYFLFRKLEKDVEWLRHELTVAGMRS